MILAPAPLCSALRTWNRWAVFKSYWGNACPNHCAVSGLKAHQSARPRRRAVLTLQDCYPLFSAKIAQHLRGESMSLTSAMSILLPALSANDILHRHCLVRRIAQLKPSTRIPHRPRYTHSHPVAPAPALRPRTLPSLPQMARQVRRPDAADLNTRQAYWLSLHPRTV